MFLGIFVILNEFFFLLFARIIYILGEELSV